MADNGLTMRRLSAPSGLRHSGDSKILSEHHTYHSTPYYHPPSSAKPPSPTGRLPTKPSVRYSPSHPRLPNRKPLILFSLTYSLRLRRYLLQLFQRKKRHLRRQAPPQTKNPSAKNFHNPPNLPPTRHTPYVPTPGISPASSHASHQRKDPSAST